MPRYLVVVNERRRVTYATEADCEQDAFTNIMECGLTDDEVESEFIEFCGEAPVARLDVSSPKGYPFGELDAEPCAKCDKPVGSDYEECGDDLLCSSCSSVFTLLCDGCDSRVYEAHSCDRLCNDCWTNRGRSVICRTPGSEEANNAAG